MEINVLRGHTRAVRALQFDQMLLFTGAMDGTVRMWNWRAGECLRVLEGHRDGVVSLHYNGYLLASGSADHTIGVWNFRTGNKFTLWGHAEWVNSVLLWDGKTSPGDLDPTQMPNFTRHRIPTSPGPQSSESKESVEEMGIDVGAMLFSASDDGTIKLWSLAQQTCIRTFEGHKAQIQSLRMIMVDMSEEDIASARRKAILQDTHLERPCVGIASEITPSLSPPCSYRAVGYESINTDHTAITDKSILHRDRSEDTVEEVKGLVEPENMVKHKKEREDATGKRTHRKPLLVSGSLDGTVKLWDVDTATERSTLFG